MKYRGPTLPVFPRTPHLPGSGNVTADDLMGELPSRWETCTCEEKLDGANVRIQFDGVSEPVIGNREKILVKGYNRKDTPAKAQFKPLWNWVYDNRSRFGFLAKTLEETPVVFGEWLYATHTIVYDRLPDFFIPFDIYLSEAGGFLDPVRSRRLLQLAGFSVPWETTFSATGMSIFGSEPREGIYLKLGDGQLCTHRFKLVRADFRSRLDFNTTELRRNRLWRP